jgi:MFS family permease
MALTACFVTLPKQIIDHGLALEQHWQLYLPVLLGSFFLMVPFMIFAIKKQQEKKVFAGAVLLLTLSLVLMWYLGPSFWLLVLAIVLFFTAFNYLEATMPSMLSRLAPAGVKGSAMGIYSSSQFFGAFVGGVLGGAISTGFDEQTIFLVMALMTFIWFVATTGMAPLKKSKSYSFATNISNEQQADAVAEQIIAMPGVIEATLVQSEAVAYLKVDDKVADLQQIRSLLNA